MFIINLDKKIMRLKSKIFINLFILFFLWRSLKLKLTILLMGAVKISVLHSLIIEAMKKKLKFLKRIRNYLKNKILISIIHYAGGNNFL